MRNTCPFYVYPLIAAALATSANVADAFYPALLAKKKFHGLPPFSWDSDRQRAAATCFMAKDKLVVIDDPDEVSKPVAFSDPVSKGTIMCHIDAVATIGDAPYYVGYPCDHAVDIAFWDDEDDLVPVEVEEPLMDELFPVVENMLDKDYKEHLKLFRTPATLTLAGNLDIDDEDDDEAAEDAGDGEDAAEVLLEFKHGGKDYCLVRPTDLMLLVGKANPNDAEGRILISDEESSAIMPTLIEMLGL